MQIFYENDYAQALAGLSIADVVLVNPLVDGMNLVAKEAAVVSQRDAVLVLSETAGAFDQMADGALPVAPADVVGTADALAAALAMPVAEARDDGATAPWRGARGIIVVAAPSVEDLAASPADRGQQRGCLGGVVRTKAGPQQAREHLAGHAPTPMIAPRRRPALRSSSTARNMSRSVGRRPKHDDATQAEALDDRGVALPLVAEPDGADLDVTGRGRSAGRDREVAERTHDRRARASGQVPCGSGTDAEITCARAQLPASRGASEDTRPGGRRPVRRRRGPRLASPARALHAVVAAIRIPGMPVSFRVSKWQSAGDDGDERVFGQGGERPSARSPGGRVGFGADG